MDLVVSWQVVGSCSLGVLQVVSTGGGGGGHSPWFWVPTAKRTLGVVAVNAV